MLQFCSILQHFCLIFVLDLLQPLQFLLTVRVCYFRGQYLSRWVVSVEISLCVCVCVCCCVSLCVTEWQIFSCVHIALMTSFPSCTMRQRGSLHIHTSGQWRRESTTATTTQFTWWIAALATSWSWRVSHHPNCQCPSSPCQVHSAMLQSHQSFTSLSSVRMRWSRRTMLYRLPNHRSATDFSRLKPSTSGSSWFRLRNSSSFAMVTVLVLVTVVDVV